MQISKILVVDDSATERYYYLDLLTRFGYDVVTAENGEEAISKARSDPPHLILMDVIMPGQNGFQVTRAMSRDPITAHIPIIMCTSKDQDTDRFWGIKQGAKDYLVKPVNADQLISKIRAFNTAA